MKSIILVAGAGKKLRPHTNTQPKPLIPVAGKPILGHIIEFLLEDGHDEMIFVIGYMGEKIKEFVIEEYQTRISYTFIEQEPRLGTAHALWLCKDLFPNEDILIVLGDTIIDTDLSEITSRTGTVLCVQEVEDPRKFGVAMINDHDIITSLIEKPAIPKSNLALVGLYKVAETDLLKSALNEILENNIQTHREYQLTDALMRMIQHGVKIGFHKVKNWYDCGKKDVLLASNRILLNRLPQQTYPDFKNTVIIPPVYIAENCEIENSVIGPFVAIAENTSIHNSILQDTILGAYATLDSIVLKSTIIGNDSSIIGRCHSINIGDNTEIDFTS